MKKNMLFLISLATAMVASCQVALADQQISSNSVTTSLNVQVSKQITSTKFSGDGYTVEFKLNSQYSGGFQGEFIITNTGNKPLENWAVKCEFPHEIISMWNGKIISHEGTKYIIKNAQWNQDIPVGGSASIGFAGTCSDKVTLPENCQVLIGKRDLKSEEYSMDFSVRSDWGKEFVGDLKITNNTNKSIEDWILEFDFDKDITYIWGMEILKHEGNHYIIKNSGYNQNIKPGQTITIGFQGNSGNVISKPSNYKMTELLQGDYSLVDNNKNDDSDKQDDKTVPSDIKDQGNGDYTDVYEVYGTKN